MDKSQPIEATFAYRAMRCALGAVARLPWWVIWGLSDLLYLLMGHVVRYRRKIITRNLAASFPDRSPREIARLRRAFYRNFTDYIFETVKLLHISDAEMRSRLTFTGVDIMDRYTAQGRPVVAYFSHCFNWEWVTSITLWTALPLHRSVEFCQVYRPLRNRAFDALMLHVRSRFGSVSLSKRVAFLDLMRYRRRGLPTVTGFMSDQKPSHGDDGHPLRFLHHPTLFITGTETVARRLDAAVVYIDMEKTARGRYHATVRLITDTPTALPPFAVTDRYATLLARTIARNPALWLWSHNRWKHPVS